MMSRPARRMSWATCLFAVLMAALAAPQAFANPVPVPTQRLVQAHFAPILVLPATAIWRFEVLKPYAGGGDLVCGHVNFQVSTRRYLGFLGFYAVVQNGKVANGGIEADSEIQDPTGAFKFAYQTLCEKPGAKGS